MLFYKHLRGGIFHILLLKGEVSKCESMAAFNEESIALYCYKILLIF